MNRYLLLRDNKQSGPYSVPEIIAKGIKPYDLVWLEGKSAAWRYPSEIEELKAYAPAVEEQPYDRFYKKPEPVAEMKPQPSLPSSFEPVVVQEPVTRKQEISKKVYINFPGGQKKLAVYPEPRKEQQPVAIAKPVPQPVEQVWEAPVTPPPAMAQEPDRRLLYAVIATCFILLAIISMLIINSGNQKTNIRRLNDMVQQMEKRQSEQNQAAKNALASRIIPTPSSSTEIVPAADPETVPETPLHKKPVNNAATSRSPKASDPAATAVTSAASATTAGVTEAPEKPITPIKKDEPATEDLYSLVSVRSNKYKIGLFGGISNLQFVLTNNSKHELQRVSVEVKYFGPEKKLIRTQTVFFEKVAPGSEPVLDVPKSNRGVTVEYAITDIKS